MPRGRGRLPQRSDSEETRQAILHAAHDLFMQRGYRAVTTRMVADASGVRQPLLYYHFSDKEALYLEVQREQATACRVALERIAARKQESIPERLCHVVRYLQRSHQQNMGMLFHELKHELKPATRVAMSELFRACVVAPIMSIFEDGIRVGFLRHPDKGGVAPRIATYLLLNAASNLPENGQGNGGASSVWWEEGRDPVVEIVNALLYGMATRFPV
jgi:AcrR family transcriptional regulator